MNDRQQKVLCYIVMASLLLMLCILLMSDAVAVDVDTYGEMIAWEDTHGLEVPPYTDTDITMLAKLMYGEARGINDTGELGNIVWCVLNRADDWGGTIAETVTAPYQFYYSVDFPTVNDYGTDLTMIAAEVLNRWAQGYRDMPIEFKWYSGDGEHNYFRDSYFPPYTFWEG